MKTKSSAARSAISIVVFRLAQPSARSLNLVADVVGVVHVVEGGGFFLGLGLGEAGLGWGEDARVGGARGKGLGVRQGGEHAGFFKDREGKVVKSALHEDVLRRLAMDTGGAYVRSSPSDFGLERIYDLGIAQLKRDEQAGHLSKIFEDRYPWFVGAALLLLLTEALVDLRGRKQGVAP